MVKWKNDQITNLLRQQSTIIDTEDDDEKLGVDSNDEDHLPCNFGQPSSSVPSTQSFEKTLAFGDVAFAVFLEPPEETDPYMNIGEKFVDSMIQRFSQKPTMVHTEIVIPPFANKKSTKIHFATYLGSHAAYQNEYDAVSGVDFYLIRHGRRWRCLPLFGKNAAEDLRRACDANVGSAYSLMMYPTSSHLFRNWSWIWSDGPMHKGHCATLTSRVIRQAGIQCGVVHKSPWYSPSSLYASIHDSIGSSIDDQQLESLRVNDLEQVESDIESILRGVLSAKTFYDIGHQRCVNAIRELTYKVVKLAKDGATPTERHHAERELGDAVFKFCLIGRDV